jgi:SAM-dependent methyltransferase
MKRTFIYPAALLVLLSAAGVLAQEPFEPKVGQSGKDVVWVPTSPELLEKMLDMADVKATDMVVDLGSGDGRNIIAAAKRGALARGVEFNPDMVALSRRLANDAGVSERAAFVEGDMYEADISDASVLALFLLPQNLDKLADKFLALTPGTRIVVNTFGITGWTPVRTERLEDNCVSWCTAMLYVVPARVAGTWRTGDADLVLTQEFQTISGTLTIDGSAVPVRQGKVEGPRITFAAGEAVYSGEVNGERMTGSLQRAGTQAKWTASRQP